MSIAERLGLALFLAILGAFGTTMGFMLATNRHGFLDWFALTSKRGSAFLARIPPWRWFIDPAWVQEVTPFERGMMRLGGWTFLIIWPAMFGVAIIAVFVGDLEPTTPDSYEGMEPGLGSVLLALVMAVAGAYAFKSLFGGGWRRGGAARAVVAAIAGATAIMIVGAGFGSIVIFLVGFALGAPGVMIYIWLDWWKGVGSASNDLSSRS